MSPTLILSGASHEEVEAPEGFTWPDGCPTCGSGLFFQIDTLWGRRQAYCYGGHLFAWSATADKVVELSDAEPLFGVSNTERKP